MPSQTKNSKAFIAQLLQEGIDQAKIEAITTIDGPMLIIAGPGSGKTKTLVERIIYLITIKKVLPENILVSTFTEKAAKELITRVSNRLLELDVKVNLNEMYIGTLHSLFLRIIEDNREYSRLKKNYSFLDQFEQAYLIYSHYDQFKGIPNIELIEGAGSRWKRCENVIKAINKISEECIEVQKLKKSNLPIMQCLAAAYESYCQLLEGENALDFSTIQVEALRLLETQPNVLKQLQQSIRYLMVDEYQDTNTIQEIILLKLAGTHNNICVVGDDDQGLYRFRGATIRNILEFPNNFTKGSCKKVQLVKNFRSHPDIIDFYNKWMEGISWSDDGRMYRYDKTVVPHEGDFVDVPTVVKVSSNRSEELYHQEVLQFIRALEQKKVLKDYNQIAFLARSVTNDGVVQLLHFLEANGVPVFSPRSGLFFEREEVRMAIGSLVYIFPFLSDWLKWDPTKDYEIQNYCESCKKDFHRALFKDKVRNKQLIQWCIKKVKDHADITDNKDYVLSKLLYELLQFPMFAEYLDVDLTQRKNDLRPAYNLALLSQLLTKFESLAGVTILTVKNHQWVLNKFFNHYLRFLLEGGMGEFEEFDEYAPSGCVSFMTIHQSKGLEFPIVFVSSLWNRPTEQNSVIDFALEQDGFYHKPAFEPRNRIKDFDFYRLYYTAFSRPQNLLVLTGFEKGGNWAMPSRCFKACYENTISWKDPLFEFRKLKLEKIKPTNIKKEYSFTSHISVYDTCPLQYKFYKDMEFSPVRYSQTMFGQLIHQTIEDIHKAAIKEEFDRITEENVNFWFDTNYASISKSQKAYLADAQKQAALKQVLAYKQRHDGKWHIIQEAEVKVSLVKEHYILSGKIDLIKGENNTVEIVDFKGERKPDINNPEVQQRLKRYQRQLEVYAHLVEERHQKKVSKMHLYYTGETNGNPNITFDYKKERISDTIKEFDQTVDLIESKAFDMSHIKKGEQLCGNCDLRFYCNSRC